MIYSEIIEAKNKSQIPLFTNKKPMHSKYDPQREAAAFIESLKENLNGNFFIIGGIGGAYHISSLLEKFPDCKIIAFEADEESLKFCLSINTVKELEDKVIFTSTENLESTILQHYFPALYGNANVFCQRIWENETTDFNYKEIIINAINKISQDYSVQCHFGKIWQRNILINFSHLNQNKIKNIPDTLKKCAVIAAGPTLDTSILKLKKNPDEYFIISTDTACSTLFENNLMPDWIVSVDSQTVSHTHFLNLPEKTEKDIQFIFDISTNPENVNFVKNKGYSVYFISSGHPLASYISEGKLTGINTGNGTVTTACCDLAYYAGFRTIELFGADFCYNNNKPYAKGTYLDRNFNYESSIFNTTEQKNSALMFRTSLKDLNSAINNKNQFVNAKTSTVMENYYFGLENWCKLRGYNRKENTLFNEKSLGYFLNAENLNSTREKITGLKRKLQEIIEANNFSSTDLPEIMPVLPFISWCRKNMESQDSKSIWNYLKLAYNSLMRYTLNYES